MFTLVILRSLSTVLYFISTLSESAADIIHKHFRTQIRPIDLDPNCWTLIHGVQLESKSLWRSGQGLFFCSPKGEHIVTALSVRSFVRPSSFCPEHNKINKRYQHQTSLVNRYG